MKLRSKWLTAFSALVLQVVPVVTADWKPAKRIEVIVPNAPGGGNDRLARLVLKIAHEQKLIDPLVNVIHKPGAGAITAAIGGHVDMPVAPAASVLPHVQAGRLRFVALAAPKRLDGALSAVPVWKDLGANAVTSNWRAMVGPRALPPAHIAYWENVFARVVESDDWKKMLERDLVTPEFLRSACLRDELKSDYEELKTVMTELGLVKQ